MSVSEIIKEIDSTLSGLRQARAILAESFSLPATKRRLRKRGRPQRVDLAKAPILPILTIRVLPPVLKRKHTTRVRPMTPLPKALTSSIPQVPVAAPPKQHSEVKQPVGLPTEEAARRFLMSASAPEADPSLP